MLDQAIFAFTNLIIYLRHPRFTLYFLRRQRHWPDFARPRDLAELVQWRKLFDRNPAFPVFADKLATKKWLAERFPDLPTPETVWVGDHVDEVPDEFVRPGYVIKLNSGTSQNYFPHRQGSGRAAFNQAARRWFSFSLRAWSYVARKTPLEWAYWPIRSKLFVERLIANGSPIDISIRVCGGYASSATCATDFKTGQDRIAFFWADGCRMMAPNETEHGDLGEDFQVPARFRDAIAYAQDISKGFDYLRVDFLTHEDQLHLSEITIYPASGFGQQTWRTAITYRYWLEALEVSWPLTTPQPWPPSLYFGAFRRWLAVRRQELGPAADFAARWGGTSPAPDSGI